MAHDSGDGVRSPLGNGIGGSAITSGPPVDIFRNPAGRGFQIKNGEVVRDGDKGAIPSGGMSLLADPPQRDGGGIRPSGQNSQKPFKLDG